MFRRLFVFAWMGSLPAVAAGTPGGVAAGAPAPATAPAPAPGGAAGTFAYITRDGTSVKVPLFSEKSDETAIARVEQETIMLSDLTRVLAAAHGAMGSSTSKAGKQDPSDILERLIEVRLVVTEARQMGIEELPEVKKAVADFETATGLELLKERVTAGVKSDPAEVTRAYRNAVREWKVKSVLFGGELEAKQHGPKLKAPKAFDAVAKQLVAEKKAKGRAEGGYLPRDAMLPAVSAALEKLKVGEVSAPVKVPDGFAVMQLMEIRYPEDAKAKAEAEQASLGARKVKALAEYYAGLVKKYAKVDQTALKALDYHAQKPGLEALRKDQRVLAQIEGGKPITVGELTEEIMSGFFHGVDRAVKEKKINPKKAEIFDGLLARRVVPLQVAAEKIPETAEFKRRVADFRIGILFSKFVEKAVVPTVKAGEAEARKYHAAHRKEFMYPTFYKVESLAFSNVKDAEGAVHKLRSGTDFKWLNANAEGQIPAAKRKLAIEGTLAATALPKGIAGALAGAKKGDYRLHAGPESQYYAIRVVDVIGAKERPFEEVREEIAQKLHNEGITNGVKRWVAIIRKARKVEVFLTRIGS